LTGDLLQIPLLDHIVVGDGKYFSFLEHCRCWPPREPRPQLTELGRIVRSDIRAQRKALKQRRKKTAEKRGHRAGDSASKT
jgi:hypothetical protein